MPIELTNSVVETVSKTVTQEEQVSIDCIDIVGQIIIDTDAHTISFKYALGHYLRDENGNILTNAEGKKRAKLIRIEEVGVGETYYSEEFMKLTQGNVPLGIEIEKHLLDLVKRIDQRFSNISTEYVEIGSFVIEP